MSEWYYDNFKNKYEYLRKIRSQRKSTKEKALIDETISTIHKLIYQPKETKFQQKIGYKLEQDYWYFAESPFLWPFIFEMSSITLPSYPNLDQETKIDFDVDTFYGLANDFYKNATDNKSFSYFSKIYSTRKETIRIIDDREKDYELQGEAVFLPYYNQVFLTIHQTGNFNDLMALIHEFGHGIHFLAHYDPGIFDSVFGEVVAMFYELISKEYFSSRKDYREIATLCQCDDFYSSVILADDIACELDFLEKFNMTSAKNIKRSISEAIKNDPEMAQGIIDFQTSLNYPYVIGDMIAIELYMIYLQDRDKAFYLLNKIMRLRYSDSEKSIFTKIEKLGIHPTEHTLDYQNILARKMDKIKE